MGTGPGDENILTYSVESSSPGDVAVSVAGDQLTMEPVLDFHGDVTITVTVEDDGWSNDATDFILTVTPVNDVPVMDAIAAQTTDEDTPLTITVSSSDIDTGTGAGDENVPAYSAISSSPGDVAVSVAGGQLTMEPVLDFHGDVMIAVTITDDGGLSDATDFILTVTPVNDAPVMDAIAAQATDEDTPLTITVSSSDVDMGTGPGY